MTSSQITDLHVYFHLHQQKVKIHELGSPLHLSYDCTPGVWQNHLQFASNKYLVSK